MSDDILDLPESAWWPPTPEQLVADAAKETARQARIDAIKAEIEAYLWDWDLPSGYAFAPEWRDTALTFIAQYVDRRDREKPAAEGGDQ